MLNLVGPPGSRDSFMAVRQTGKVVPPPAPFSEARGTAVTSPIRDRPDREAFTL